ncbi:NAD/NADP-dependent octopine/nopaline dehydrogenase family protein [Candidatus Formimonas warabiya]|uniref:NADP transhydrogenase subunit alpha n=1 Tax=Formimonas warabiya TaxID=1761012 RepID=A0A3G1KNL2_FORW1|nr:NAD/NADP-dependent octopine/nopaline dehydrogenase family protein [Candidatus Formimonas warabiya]ATW23705.1 NADP transhydrogenase subunit alpha [Candidatus Formimonas warabiya]
MEVVEHKQYPKFAVLGAGHGGTAMAGHLSLMGFDVSLYNRGPDRIMAMQAGGGLEIITDNDLIPRGFAEIEIVTSDPAKAIAGRDIIMVVVPATGHRYIAEQIAPHLVDGQFVILNPGRTGGALEVLQVLRDSGCKAEIVVAEAQTLLYASRSVNPAQTTIFRLKNSIPVAALPAHSTPEVVKALRVAFPQFVPGDNVMKTSLDNIGAIFHPAVTTLNAGRIESTNGDFDYYTEGITPSVALILEKMDQERVHVAESLGFRAMTAREWLYIAYDAAGRTLHEAMRANRGYDGIKAPKTVFHRYISEDIPMSLVPIASLGRLGNVPTPTIDAIILLGSTLHQTDYWAQGRTVERMGLAGMSLKQLRRFIIDGER